MFERSVNGALAATVLPCLLLAACASADRGLAKGTPVETRKSLVAAADYGKALDGFEEAQKRDSQSKELAANYLRTVENIKQAADGARRQKDYVRAGGIYRVLFDRYDDFGKFAAKLTFKKIQLGTALKECRVATVDDPAAQAVKAGSFAKANDIFRAALKEHSEDPDLAAKYLGMLGDIKAVGDKAFVAGNLSLAGRVSTFLLKCFPSYEGLRPPVAFSRESLQEVIASCREGLTQTGLEEYRKGELAKAITTWESLLAFDPHNAEIRKAVATATTQLDAIKRQK